MIHELSVPQFYYLLRQVVLFWGLTEIIHISIYTVNRTSETAMECYLLLMFIYWNDKLWNRGKEEFYWVPLLVGCTAGVSKLLSWLFFFFSPSHFLVLGLYFMAPSPLVDRKTVSQWFLYFNSKNLRLYGKGEWGLELELRLPSLWFW